VLDNIFATPHYSFIALHWAFNDLISISLAKIKVC
jgi:hypothetical protein